MTPPRPRSKCFDSLGFKLIKENGKYHVLCLQCDKILMNSAESRLKSHRNVCALKQQEQGQRQRSRSASDSSSDSIALGTLREKYLRKTEQKRLLSSSQTSNVDEGLATTPTVITELEADENGILNTVSESFIYSSSEVPLPSPSTSSFSTKKSELDSFVLRLQSTDDTDTDGTKKTTKKTNTKSQRIDKTKNKITKYVDTLENEDLSSINEALAIFFFGCNIPFQVIESKYFQNFVSRLRPAYKEKIPSRKTLATSLLEQCYNKCIDLTVPNIQSNSVLIIDGWKNTACNVKTVVTMLHCADGTQAFLNAWDLSLESETGERLLEIVQESIKLSKDLFNTNVYAVVSDNASPMVKMGELGSHLIWHSTCSSHTANLLCKDILDKKVIEMVTNILKEFKHSNYETLLVQKGGKRIKLPCEVRWCSYRNSLLNLIENLSFMKSVAAEEKTKKMKENVVTLLYNTKFIEQVKQNLELLNPVCEIINICQNKKASIADAANFWLQLRLPETKKQVLDCLEKRQKMALNTYALVAYYLHPNYENAFLTQEHKQRINRFFLKHLDSADLDELEKFQNKSGIFQLCFAKKIKNPLTFWNLAEADCPKLSALALKLLRIPAASAQIERVFSSWGFVHSSNRNRLVFQRSKKLTHLYYSLRIGDIEFLENEDIEEE